MRAAHRLARKALASILLAVCALLLILSVALSYHQGRKDGFVPSGRKGAPVTAVRLPEGNVAVNTGGLMELEELPGIGPVIARRMLEERERHGPYFYPEDLLDVRGIGEKTLARIRDRLDLSCPSSEDEP
ncbi:MAG: ComEA family DNA-binding protein [Aristaeellaceae bacterium]